jgi:hypothetical protein
MEPDGHDEELPEPTGVTINLSPDRVIQALQRRAAQLIQNLQWDLATRDATIEVLEERLHEAECYARRLRGDEQARDDRTRGGAVSSRSCRSEVRAVLMDTPPPRRA